MNMIGSLTGSVITGTMLSPSRLVTVADTTNPAFSRVIQLTDSGLKLYASGSTVGIALTALTTLVAAHYPGYTWPPIIGTQPANVSVTHPAAGTFTVAANDEAGGGDISYQWQEYPFGGSSWANLTAGGTAAYGGVTTGTLTIGTSTALNGWQYRVQCANPSGTTASKAALFTVA